MVTTSSASTTAFEAAKEIRVKLREIMERYQENAYAQSSTDSLLLSLEGAKKKAEMEALIPRLRVLINEERTKAAALFSRPEIIRLQELSQSLPTAPNLPGSDRHENTIRAIAAVLKSQGFDIEQAEEPAPEEKVVT